MARKKTRQYQHVAWNLPYRAYARLKREVNRRAKAGEKPYGLLARTAASAIEAGLEKLEKEKLG